MNFHFIIFLSQNHNNIYQQNCKPDLKNIYHSYFPSASGLWKMHR
ncbi:hypothetical protein UYSO10_3214 [Kosakonia radicincitans]|nr:hypothetical protein UYSO10_3214 [Kosakonia radicincitans]